MRWLSSRPFQQAEQIHRFGVICTPPPGATTTLQRWQGRSGPSLVLRPARKTGVAQYGTAQPFSRCTVTPLMPGGRLLLPTAESMNVLSPPPATRM